MKHLMDNLLECKIDGEAFDTEKELHKHLRKHKIRVAEYYQKYYPRYDKRDGKMIKFKNFLWNRYLPSAKTTKLVNRVMVIQSNETIVFSMGSIIRF